MSVTRVRCANLCSRREKSEEPIWVSLELRKASYCDSCRHMHEDRHDLWFCSPDCVADYFATKKDRFDDTVQRFRKGVRLDEW